MTSRDASREWLRKLIAAINATTNPPETAVEPDGVSSLSHGRFSAPSGSDHFEHQVLQQARAC